mgnify:CR=1 FL=1
MNHAKLYLFHISEIHARTAGLHSYKFLLAALTFQTSSMVWSRRCWYLGHQPSWCWMAIWLKGYQWGKATWCLCHRAGISLDVSAYSKNALIWWKWEQTPDYCTLLSSSHVYALFLKQSMPAARCTFTVSYIKKVPGPPYYPVDHFSILSDYLQNSLPPSKKRIILWTVLFAPIFPHDQPSAATKSQNTTSILIQKIHLSFIKQFFLRWYHKQYCLACGQPYAVTKTQQNSTFILIQ